MTKTSAQRSGRTIANSTTAWPDSPRTRRETPAARWPRAVSPVARVPRCARKFIVRPRRKRTLERRVRDVLDVVADAGDPRRHRAVEQREHCDQRDRDEREHEAVLRDSLAVLALQIERENAAHDERDPLGHLPTSRMRTGRPRVRRPCVALIKPGRAAADNA